MSLLLGEKRPSTSWQTLVVEKTVEKDSENALKHPTQRETCVEISHHEEEATAAADHDDRQRKTAAQTQQEEMNEGN